MSNHTRAMLESLYDAFYESNLDSTRAWDRMLAFIAAFHYSPLINQLDDELDWVGEDSRLTTKVREVFDPVILRQDRSDTLGEMYVENFLSDYSARKLGVALTPLAVACAMATSVVPETTRRVRVLDPSARTGRLLLAAWQRAPNGIFLGIDDDLKMLRIAFTNTRIHHIHGYLLHANYLVHATDIETEAGRHNWKYANNWYSKMNELLPITPLQN